MQIQYLTDKTAIGISMLCAIHCVMTPLAVLAIPSFGASFFADEHFHQLLIYMVLPISVVAMTLGCRKHRNFRVWGLGGAGLACLVAAAFFLHDLIGERGEQLMTLLGTVLVASAHWQNYKLCRKQSCQCDGSKMAEDTVA